MSYDYDSLNVHSATLRFTPLITDQQDVQVEIAFHTTVALLSAGQEGSPLRKAQQASD